MIDAVNALLECAMIGICTALALMVMAWLGLLPMIIVGEKVDEDEGA